MSRRNGTPARLAALILAALSAAMLSGCGNQQPEQSPVLTPGPPIEETAPQNDQAEPTPTPTPEPTPIPTPTPKPQGTGLLYRRPENTVPMPTATMDASLSQDQKITEIRRWFYDAEAKQKSNALDEHVYDDDIRSWWENGQLVKAEVREILDPAAPEGTTYQYYYHNGAPYFAYIVGSKPHTELRLYFWNTQLIRWIETDMKVHDLEEHSAYAETCQAMWDLYQTILAVEADLA